MPKLLRMSAKGLNYLFKHMNNRFSSRLLEWDENFNFRKMPWKGENNPYRVWLSEIILQQTRVEQGLAYYERFISTFPDINSLAKADDEFVFKLWEGLGYYSRCRNLLKTARYIAFERDGFFPDTYNDILRLYGVGPYTAAAIASFAFDLPHAVVDGNVVRVLSRFFGIYSSAASAEGKSLFSKLANELLDKDRPAQYNQAIMDHGATICKPKNPDCVNCPFSSDCVAFNTGKIADLPVKDRKLVRKKRFFNYYLIELDGNFYYRKRKEKDIWQDLNELVLFEAEDLNDLHNFSFFQHDKVSYELVHKSEVFTQHLTHQEVKAIFSHIKLSGKLPLEGYDLEPRWKFSMLSFPAIINEYFNSTAFFK